MEISNHAHDDEQQDSKGAWREWGLRHTELRSNPKSAYLFESVPNNWHNAAVEGDFSKLDEVKALNQEGLTASNYTKRLRTLLMMEQTYESIDIRRFDMFRKRLMREYGQLRGALYSSPHGVSVPGLSSGQLKLRPDDHVILSDLYHNYEIATIDIIRGDFVALDWQSSNRETFLNGQLDIFFVANEYLYPLYESGLNRFDSDFSLRVRLFQDESRACEDELERSHASVDCVLSEDEERLNQLNGPQRQAIINIVEANFGPKPYILLGPPGTGKTHTLAETIAQIYTRKPDCRILYSANSDTSVDQMAYRLKKIMGSCDMVRLRAHMNPISSRDKIPIILTTNLKSSTLIDSHEFDYVFIDDAGHAHEAESLLPICCLRESGCLVLAGDPKQLDPVVKCQQASKYGLSMTLLNRLLKFDIYQRDCATSQYDSKYITKLLVSYRCDSRILSISNKLFHDSELKCVNETPKSLLKMMRITNPLQFHHVEGQEEQPGYSSSWRNYEEVDQCVDLIIRLYKMGLKPDQIGVISPYKLQTEEIRENLDRKLKTLRGFLEKRFRDVGIFWSIITGPGFYPSILDSGDSTDCELGMVEDVKERDDKWLCKIDSVDAFQGNEREVIIISTVKTYSKGELALVNDPRHFNVAISRAKGLVFVIGHEGFLQKQSNWNQFIRHAGREMSRWPLQSKSDRKHPFKQSRPLFGPSN